MKREKGFTLVEVIIASAILSVLAGIAIPNFMQSRINSRKAACIVNLKRIQGAIPLWALDSGKGDADAVTIADLVPTYIKNTPYCPSDTSRIGYATTTVSENPTCPTDPTNHALQ